MITDNDEFRRIGSNKKDHLSKLECKKLDGKRTILAVDAKIEEMKINKLLKEGDNYA